MSKIYRFINDYFKRFFISIKRFFIPFIFSLVIAIFFVYNIWDSNDNLLIWTFAIILAFPISVLIVLVFESYDLKWEKIVNAIISLGIIVLNKYYIDNLFDNNYFLLGFIGFYIIVFVLICFYLYKSFGDKKIFGHCIKTAFLCSVIMSIVETGVMICFLAVNYLIFYFKRMDDWIISIIVTLFIVLFTNLFLSFIPKKGEDIKLPRVYDIIVNKIGLGIYMLLITILYVYFMKIVITWTLPNGKINWFASFALLFYCFFYLSNKGYQGAINDLFDRYGGFLMLPIMALQGFAIYVRISNYGLTTFRYLSILLNVIALLFVIDSIIHKKTKWVFIGAIVVFILATMTPLNIIKVPIDAQEKIIVDILNDNNLLSDGKILSCANLSKNDKDKLFSAYSYLKNNKSSLRGNQLMYVGDFKGIYGFSYYSDEEVVDEEYVSIYYYRDDIIFDVRNYNEFYPFQYVTYDEYYCVVEGFDITNFVKQLVENYDGVSAKEGDYYLDVENGARLYFTDIYIDAVGDKIEYVNLEGYVLR